MLSPGRLCRYVLLQLVPTGQGGDLNEELEDIPPAEKEAPFFVCIANSQPLVLPAFRDVCHVCDVFLFPALGSTFVKVDPLRHAQIRREVNGKEYFGHVEEIEQGKITKESVFAAQ